MLIDAHAHLWREDIVGSKKTVLRLCERYDIRKVFISTLNDGAHDPDEAELRASNVETHRFMQEHPGLVEGMVYLNPKNDDSISEMRRNIEDYGMKGVKLWIATYCDDERVNPIAELAIAYGVPVLVHAFYKTVRQLPAESRGHHVANLARRYPQLRILMAHLGANVYDAIRCVKDCPNVWVDHSGSLFRGDDLDYTIEHLGVGRVLFGSDMPGSFEACYGQVHGADISGEEKRQLFYQNAVRFFQLKEDVR